MEAAALLEKIDNKRKNKNDARETFAAVLEGNRVDILPIIFWRSHSEAAGTAVSTSPGTSYTMKEQFYSKEKMLLGHLEEIAEVAGDTHQGIFCLRPNFGTIFVPAILGLDFHVPEDEFPWLTEKLNKTEVNKLKIAGLEGSSMMERAIEYLLYFQANLPDWIHVYLPDTQGPFDLAHLIYGDDIFLDIYEDPEFVHYLLELATTVYIEVTEKLKEVLGEKRNECYHGQALPRGIYMSNGGTRISEDTATLISPAHIDEFVIPYDHRALQAFGGGFVHYCGKHEYLLESYLQLDEVRAINFGNPEKYDFTKTMDKFLQYNKTYFGLWPKEDREDLKGYINRMLEATEGGSRGMLLHFDQELFIDYSTEEILALWQKMIEQD